MDKIKWGAKHDYEYIENYKILQQAFEKNEMKKYIDVDKLVKAKYQDNLEFLQWMKRYFEINYNGQEYDAVGDAKARICITSWEDQIRQQQFKSGSETSCKALLKAGTGIAKAPASKAAAAQPKPVPVPKKQEAGVAQANEQQLEEMKLLQDELQEVKLNNDTLEKERDFYFGKLRDIELFL
eukprot:CAMPEP_0202956170 /NCGR_PEP_ID=MMETSP1396-20130829/715_1 /ASSEMBLY_ACC=CAM_ASM_000872 /TAXON_ID= /ORGANISM="Pseudokeronopsis sp., Strain Brazil" /LENGTH=181 /DNA_ID=CAMNT_0049673077 /DNA_START=180 /DNA_END=728 /DNA_ORIENTATION=-